MQIDFRQREKVFLILDNLRVHHSAKVTEAAVFFNAPFTGYAAQL